ncbi:hypothetical protein KY289_030551 [Solanum tuberosum]|nr:hypothetical protein KY289_030551 [Solanum tuberosum]
MPKDNDLHAAEVSDNNVCFSRTLIAIKEEAKKNVKELKALRDAAKKEVEDVDSKVLEAEHEFDICAVFL